MNWDLIWSSNARRRAGANPGLDEPGGKPFAYSLPDLVLKRLHRIDQRCSGEVAMDEVVTSERQAGQRFLVNSLTEEAIRSSQGLLTRRRRGRTYVFEPLPNLAERLRDLGG
jgi:hypothetical protein